MTDVYDTIGATYSRTRRADTRIVDRMVTLLDLKPGARILDVGAGTGNYSVALRVTRGLAKSILCQSTRCDDKIKKYRP